MGKFALISDFDGTITAKDFYLLIAQRYMGPDAMQIWDGYREGKLTHFEAMQGFFSHAPDKDGELEVLLRDVQPDPRLAESAEALEANGWDLIIVSAGSSWYIDQILNRLGVNAIIHANPGEIVPGRGLVTRLPEQSPFFCPNVGIDKVAVVGDALKRYQQVVFAGDGPPDLAPALLVDPDRRFARGFLAHELHSRGEKYVPFENWTEIADTILRKR